MKSPKEIIQEDHGPMWRFYKLKKPILPFKEASYLQAFQKGGIVAAAQIYRYISKCELEFSSIIYNHITINSTVAHR